jgi:hypothetical protein
VLSNKENEDYGVANSASGRDLAHRVSHRLLVGAIPDGLVVRHTCDTPRCCQPAHLIIGTQPDNVQDKVDRSRQSRGPAHGDKIRGSRHGRTHLSEGDVVRIRAMYQAGGQTHAELAAAFGVSRATVSMLISRQTWQHI